jgi:hypothetical protein
MKTLLEKIENDLLKKPWTINASMWLSLNKIKEPWIAEISPYQYARMGKNQKAAYDKKRNDEWSKASDAKKEWASLVYRAYKNGSFDLNSPDVHPDAKQAVKLGRYREDEDVKEEAFKKAEKENRIKDTSQLKVGDTVFSVMFGNYAEIKKVNKKSIIIEYKGRQMKTSPMALTWLKYGDLKDKFFGGNK